MDLVKSLQQEFIHGVSEPTNTETPLQELQETCTRNSPCLQQGCLICGTLIEHIRNLSQQDHIHGVSALLKALNKRKKISKIVWKNFIHSIFLFNYKARDNTNKNHNLLCSLDPPNQSWLFWLVGPFVHRFLQMLLNGICTFLVLSFSLNAQLVLKMWKIFLYT